MNEIIKIGCPVCGNIVMVRNSENIEKKLFKCPVCNTKSKIGDSRIIGYSDAPNIDTKKGAPAAAAQGQTSSASYPNLPSFKPNSPAQQAPSANAYAQTGEIVKVKCGCGLVLSFKYKAGAEKSYIICPKCQRKNQISNLERVGGKYTQSPLGHSNPSLHGGTSPIPRTNTPIPGTSSNVPGHSNPLNRTSPKPSTSTPIPSLGGKDSYSQERDRTRIPGIDDYVGLGFNPLANELKNKPLATLRVKGTPKTYQLSRGRNVIGKKVDSSKATVQIETETRRMSREHLVIETQDTSNGVAYYISLFKEKVNPTFIDNTRLEYGDKIRIENGTEIRLPDMTLLFEIPGSDTTQLN